MSTEASDIQLEELLPVETSAEDKNEVNIESEQKKTKHPRIFHCTECNKSYTTHYYFVVHNRIHKNEKPLKCKECGKQFNHLSSLIDHKRIHKNKSKEFGCDQCDKKFALKSYLLKHLKIHKAPNFKCDECGMVLKTKQNLNFHKMNSHSEDHQRHVCDQCNTTFSHPSSLGKHKKYTCGKILHKCDQCKKVFRLIEDLLNHKKKNHSENPEILHKCDQCYTTFKSIHNLSRHKKKRHSAKVPKCDQCDRKFRSVQNLLNHQKKSHSENSGNCDTEEVYNCDACNKSYTRKDSLAKHKRVCIKQKTSEFEILSTIKIEPEEVEYDDNFVTLN